MNHELWHRANCLKMTKLAWKQHLSSDIHCFVLICLFLLLLIVTFALIAEVFAAVAASTSAEVNVRSHQARLGLARALSRQSVDLNKVKKLYMEAIDMAPNVSFNAVFIFSVWVVIMASFSFCWKQLIVTTSWNWNASLIQQTMWYHWLGPGFVCIYVPATV